MNKTPCQQPPKGWICRRNAGHFGPCAASRAERSAIMQAIGQALTTKLSEMTREFEGIDWHDSDTVDDVLDVIEPILAAPIPMVLHCPKCHVQHIDESNAEEIRITAAERGFVHGSRDWEDFIEKNEWSNPPHKSHLCKGCGWIWRPADVATTGVQAVETHGENDSIEEGT